MSEAFLETFILLALAHTLADFVFQTDWMVANKRNPAVLALHGGIVFALTFGALGGGLYLALGITAAHLVIDAVKLYALPVRLWSYLADQAAHFATLAVGAWLLPQTVATGLWADYTITALPVAVFISGLVLATFAGAPAVGGLMAPYRDAAQPEGLENAGKIIGLLERALIFLMVMIGEPAGIGFLIAAKSILRFDAVSKDRRISEYVIIGTLASFGWALIVAFGADATLEWLNAGPITTPG